MYQQKLHGIRRRSSVALHLELQKVLPTLERGLRKEAGVAECGVASAQRSLPPLQQVAREAQ